MLTLIYYVTKWIQKKKQERKERLFAEFKRWVLPEASAAGEYGAIKFMRKNTDVGLDYVPYGRGDSWAIFCLRGEKKQYVRFKRFSRGQSLEEVMRYINQAAEKDNERFSFDGPPYHLFPALDAWEKVEYESWRKKYKNKEIK